MTAMRIVRITYHRENGDMIERATETGDWYNIRKRYAPKEVNHLAAAVNTIFATNLPRIRVNGLAGFYYIVTKVE